ncbi:MAG: hypothetical protein R3B90_17005 [Planctomycetaceae bacterium]
MTFLKDLARFGFAAVTYGSVGIGAFGADPVASIRTFAAPDGETYYAVSLQLEASEASLVERDHVVLVDTSASQVGEYRARTNEVLAGLLQSLPAHDRVQILAVDVDVAPMTSEFVSPANALADALPRLDDRFPAGATNLLRGLTAARDLIKGDRAASIVYLGDGMSTAHLLASEELTALVDSLHERRIPVHGMAIGVNKDVKLLGILAQRTGGRLLIDDWRDDADVTAELQGRQLAQAAGQAVFYASDVVTEIEILPGIPLPVRSDRTTVFLGRGEVAGQKLKLVSAGGEHQWMLTEPQSTAGNTFLFGLYQQAEAFPELGAGLAGENSLTFAQTAFEDHIAALEAAGTEAIREQDFVRAEQIGFAIRSIDPGNVRAVGLINGAFEKSQDGEVAFLDDAVVPTDDAAEPLANPAAADPLAGREAPATDQGYLTIARDRQNLRAQRLQQELDQTMQAANQVLRVDPEQAVGMLDSLRNKIKSATDISPDARDSMLRELGSFQQFVRNQATQRQSELLDLQIKQRKQEQQERLIEYTELQDEKMQQLVERVRTLLVDFRAGDDNAAEEAEMVGRLIVDLRPGNPLGMAAITVSEAAGQLRKALRLRSLRADRYLEALYQVEKSHVPFPDEPPVRYPPAEVWQALTERRKKWASVDLKQNNPNEAKIYEALEKKVEIEFIDTELGQALEYLKDRYQIPIIPDETRMTEYGVGLDQPVNLVIAGISMRSALKLLLEPYELTYIVEDEVMKITTAEYANELLQTRVYPVADLVIPIQPIFGGFGGQGLNGGFNGNQNGGAAQNGGGFGGGGGGGGGFNVNVGGGGGGGGFFSVPAEESPRFDNRFIEGNRAGVKKKPAQLN